MRSGRRRAAIVALLVAVVCAAAGIFMLISDSAEEARYDRVEESARTASADGSAVDMDAVAQSVPGAVAWLSVKNTSISYPVMQATGDDPEYYLDHDAWGGASGDGTPFLDYRCSIDSGNMLVYGHHVIFTDRMFSPLYKAYRQDVLDAIGDAIWEDGTTQAVFRPVMSMSQDASYSPIQRFSFTGQQDMCTWLTDLAQDASAKVDGWESRIESAERTLTLVTCSSDISGRRMRTITVFVEE